MFGFIKKWFKKEEEPEQYHYFDLQKGLIRIEELEQFKRREYLNKEFSLLYTIRGNFYNDALENHIRNCIEYNEIGTAISHLNFLCSFCFNINNPILERCWALVKNSKEYKQMKLNEKLERMKADFE